MRKLLLLLFFIPLFTFSQKDIERYKVYDTDNIYTSILLDSATGLIWQLQIGLGDSSSRMKTVLNDVQFAETIESMTEQHNASMKSWEETYKDNPDFTEKEIEYNKPLTLEKKISLSSALNMIAENGRFKLYPTGNTYNFIMVDVIDGRTWQVQWNIDEDSRFVNRIW